MENSLWLCVRIVLVTHVEEEFDVGGPDLKGLVVLLAQLTEDVLDEFSLVCASVNINKLQVDLLAVVDVESSLDNSRKLVLSAKFGL